MRLDVAYDLACSPASYDFVSFLLRCEMDRIDRGADELAIHILPGPNGGFRQDPYWPFSLDERRAMLERVVLPMARLLPSVAGCIVHPDRSRPVPLGLMESRYGFRWQVEAAKRNVYPFRPFGLAPIERPRPYVTITLREAEHWPSRNSSVGEWINVAHILRVRGYTVIFIRDSAKADEAIFGSITWPSGSRDLHARMALYAGAAQNFFVNNGPAWLCWFAGYPAMIFKMCAPDAPCVNERFFAAAGLPPGTQLANARPEQRIVWADDTAENILSAYGALGLAA